MRRLAVGQPVAAGPHSCHRPTGAVEIVVRSRHGLPVLAQRKLPTPLGPV